MATAQSRKSHRNTGKLDTLRVITLVAIACAYVPILFVFFQQSWYLPQFQYFPFVLGAFGWLLWSRWKEAGRAEKAGSPTWLLYVLATVAWLLLLAATLLYNPWASAISVILLTACVCLLLARRRDVTYLWGVWALLWLIVPAPLNFEARIIAKLQLWSSWFSSLILDFAGIPHVMQGNTLLLAGRELFVDEACSGIISVRSLIACAVIYGVWRNRPPLHVLALALAGVFWAVLMNVVRISSIAIALSSYDVDWTKGAPHEILSLVVFVVAFGLLISTDALLEAVLAPILPNWSLRMGGDLNFGGRLVALWEWLVQLGDPLLEDAEEAGDERRERGSTTKGERGWLRSGLVAFGALAAVQWVFLGWAWMHPATAAEGVPRAERLEASALPTDLAGMKFVDFAEERRETGSIFGEYSRIYRYEDSEGRQYTLSCDFPFAQGWHELTICYSGAGWEVTKRDWSEAPDRDDQVWGAIEIDLEKENERQAFVSWSIFDENGDPVAPPAGQIRDQFWRLLARRHPLVHSNQLFQIQVFATINEATADEVKENARKLLREARVRLRSQIIDGAVQSQLQPSIGEPQAASN